MKKQQWIVVASGLVLLLGLYFGGRTKPLASKTPVAEAASDHKDEQLDSGSILETAKSRLSPEWQAWLTAKENSVVRGDVAAQKIKLYDELATFWKDSG